MTSKLEFECLDDGVRMHLNMGLCGGMLDSSKDPNEAIRVKEHTGLWVVRFETEANHESIVAVNGQRNANCALAQNGKIIGLIGHVRTDIITETVHKISITYAGCQAPGYEGRLVAWNG